MPTHHSGQEEKEQLSATRRPRQPKQPTANQEGQGNAHQYHLPFASPPKITHLPPKPIPPMRPFTMPAASSSGL